MKSCLTFMSVRTNETVRSITGCLRIEVLRAPDSLGYRWKLISVKFHWYATQRQWQRQRCMEMAAANGNSETATEERQQNDGNWAQL